jgi:hypothetical protein
MKTYKLWLALLAVLAIVAGMLSDKPARAITWGKLDNGRHRNVGAVMAIVPEWSPDPWFRMTGTLIAPNLFLTAGHGTCVIEYDLAMGFYPIEDLYITFADDPYDTSFYLPIKAVHTHPGYKPAKSTEELWIDAHGLGSINIEDVGVLVLAEPVDIEPEALPPAGFLDELKSEGMLDRDSTFLSVGYGSHATHAPPGSVYEPHDREMVTSTYMGITKRWLNLSMNPVLGNGGGGYGDSGGPKFWIDPTDGSEYLVAITSRGDPKLVALDVAYRIDTPTALEFIEAVAAEYP